MCRCTTLQRRRWLNYVHVHRYCSICYWGVAQFSTRGQQEGSGFNAVCMFACFLGGGGGGVSVFLRECRFIPTDHKLAARLIGALLLYNIYCFSVLVIVFSTLVHQ